MDTLATIISQISDIEERSQLIVDHATEQKKEYELEYKKRMNEFDMKLQEETTQKVIMIRNKLKDEVADALTKQREQTNQHLLSLQEEYEHNHEVLANDILQSLIGA